MYILQNQDGYFLAKSGDWVDGREPTQLFKTVHHDEAANQLFEVNSRDYTLRIKMLECEAGPKGQPVITEDLLPPPLPLFAEQQEADHVAIPEQEDTGENLTEHTNHEAMAS